MLQGTSSSAGKSALTAGFLRYFAHKGINCSPFKSQNMSLNSYVTGDGFEIAVSQAVQSEAAFKKPLRQINPILIKPSSDAEMHLIVEGKHFGNMNFKDYNRRKDFFLRKAADSFQFLLELNDLIILEGAGSPAEINLFRYDIANMGFAEVYGIPVILIADIERGGVFASLYGTVKLLPSKWRKLVKGFIINKFRGEFSILEPGIRQMEKSLKIPCLGVIPHIKNLYIEAEDSLNIKIGDDGASASSPAVGGRLNIGIVRLEHIANFNEFDPLFFDGRLNVRFFDRVPSGKNAFDIIIIPGSKSTAADLSSIKNSGIFDYIKDFEKTGGFVMGICGGFQMMGKLIKDPYCLESPVSVQASAGGGAEGMEGKKGMGGISGLGFFKAETVLLKEKILKNKKYKFNGSLLDGYEIHNGRTFFTKGCRYADILIDISEPAGNCGGKDGNGESGACSFSSKTCVLSKDGRKIGTYVHGLFANEIFKDFIIEIAGGSVKNKQKAENGSGSYAAVKNRGFELLSDTIENCVDINLFEKIAGI